MDSKKPLFQQIQQSPRARAREMLVECYKHCLSRVYMYSYRQEYVISKGNDLGIKILEERARKELGYTNFNFGAIRLECISKSQYIGKLQMLLGLAIKEEKLGK